MSYLRLKCWKYVHISITALIMNCNDLFTCLPSPSSTTPPPMHNTAPGIQQVCHSCWMDGCMNKVEFLSAKMQVAYRSPGKFWFPSCIHLALKDSLNGIWVLQMCCPVIFKTFQMALVPSQFYCVNISSTCFHLLKLSENQLFPL